MGRSEAVGQRIVPGSGDEDPRVLTLQRKVTRLRGELDEYPHELCDRRIAEEGLDALAAMAAAGVPDVPELRYALLQVVGAVGSVSALAEATAAVRNAVELFGEPAPRSYRVQVSPAVAGGDAG